MPQASTTAYAVPKTGDAMKGVNKNQKIYFHKLEPSRPRTCWFMNAPTTRTGA